MQQNYLPKTTTTINWSKNVQKQQFLPQWPQKSKRLRQIPKSLESNNISNFINKIKKILKTKKIIH